ncbi:MAG: hypothetical protein WCG81_01000 [Candidatus Angelobacter sp.]
MAPWKHKVQAVLGFPGSPADQQCLSGDGFRRRRSRQTTTAKYKRKAVSQSMKIGEILSQNCRSSLCLRLSDIAKQAACKIKFNSQVDFSQWINPADIITFRSFYSKGLRVDQQARIFIHGCSVANRASPIETNIRNLAQQRDFHGKPEDFPLETVMSGHESRFAPIVDEMRLGHLSEVALPTIREFVIHLIIRTKNIRAGFVETTNNFLNEFGAAIPLMNRKRLKNKIKKEVRKQMREPQVLDAIQQLPKERRKLFARAFEQRILQMDFRPTLSALFDSVREKIDLEKAANTGHIQTLTRGIAPQSWIENVSHLQWRLVTSNPRSFILGDVGIFGRSAGEVVYRNLLGFVTPIEMVVAPISHSVCLFGTAGAMALPNVEEINENTAQLSREFFLASQSTDRETQYRLHLGKRASLMSNTEISDIVEDIT